MPYAIIETVPKSFLKPIKVKCNVDEMLIKVPKFKEKKEVKYAKKINRILNQKKISNVVLTKDLMNLENFKNILYENNIYLITGKRLYRVLLMQVLRNLSELMNVEVEQMNIAFLVNEYNIENVDNIKYIANQVKQVTIVTTNLNRYQKVSESLFEQNGITMKVTDNLKTNLKNIMVVINYDFEIEEIRKVNIPRECIFIATNKKLSTLKKNFNGIIMNSLDIILHNDIEEVESLALTEAYMYDYLKKVKENEETFMKSGYVINGYIGSNGYISKTDFERVGKSFRIKNDKMIR